jgi:hypothetical protein
MLRTAHPRGLDRHHYGYRITRIEAPDVETLARAWSDADRRVPGWPALSRDTVREVVAGVSPHRGLQPACCRGRAIWGALVPGAGLATRADFATHLETSAALRIGGAELPASTYTLWMLPSRNGQSFLIINSHTRIFGTNYNPSRDFARVPLTRAALSPAVERLTTPSRTGGSGSVGVMPRGRAHRAK